MTDATAIQFRMLNRSKGPAMWSPRAQCDRAKFIEAWRHVVENTENLSIWQDEVAEVIAENGEVKGVTTVWGAELRARGLGSHRLLARTGATLGTHEDGYARSH